MAAYYFSIPRGDYRKYPFRLTLCRVTQDMQGYTFYFTVKKYVTDPDTRIIFQKIVTIPLGTPVYCSFFEVLPEDSDQPPANYWIEASAVKNPAQPITAAPAVFQITERLLKEF